MTPERAAAREPWTAWSGERQRRIERVLERLLPPGGAGSATLHRAMRYAVLDGGIRVRPVRVYAASQGVAAPLGVADTAAAAVELIHGYSLVHDDLPCMDN